MVFVDSEYLQQTVGPPLAGGCAATAAARPSDPVEHLAHWLLRCCDGQYVCVWNFVINKLPLEKKGGELLS